MPEGARDHMKISSYVVRHIIRSVKMRFGRNVVKLAIVQRYASIRPECEVNRMVSAPVFEEFTPAPEACDCPGCRHWRRVLPGTPVTHPASHRLLAVTAGVAGVAAASAPAGVTPAVAAPAAASPVRSALPELSGPAGVSGLSGLPAAVPAVAPQGAPAPLYGPGGRRPAGPRAVARDEILRRARSWVAAQVPYSMSRYWSDGYRQDCSGFVSMAWGLPGNEWTGSLKRYAVRISKDELRPGDILLHHNRANPLNGSHVVIFGGWTDYTHKRYIAYEQTRPHARRRVTPYEYWTGAAGYVPYRYKGLVGGGLSGDSGHHGDQGDHGDSGGHGDHGDSGPSNGSGDYGDHGDTGAHGESYGESYGRRFPGRAYFGAGAHNAYVTRLGEMLVERGGGRFYEDGPGPRWTGADRGATRAFQRAQGWTGEDADGLPGPATWALLVRGDGNDIPRGDEAAGSHGVPGFPGRAMFRPGASNKYVTRLGRQLVRKGYDRFYDDGPGPDWSDADRRATQAFQRAQGWRGGAADGYPGPETWRRLFS